MATDALASVIVIVFLLFFVFCVLFAGAFIGIGAWSVLRWLWYHLT